MDKKNKKNNEIISVDIVKKEMDKNMEYGILGAFVKLAFAKTAFAFVEQEIKGVEIKTVNVQRKCHIFED